MPNFALNYKDDKQGADVRWYLDKLKKTRDALWIEDEDKRKDALDRLAADMQAQSQASSSARAIREAEQKKREREARQAESGKEAHARHVESVTCMDLPLDFENAFAQDETVTVCAETVSDGLMKCLDRLGRVDIEYIASVTGKTLKEVIVKLEGSIFQNPTTWGECFYKGWETSDEYLSGNLVSKLKIARSANKEYGGYFKKNVKALAKLVPPALEAEDIYVTIGSPWVPTDVIDAFIRHVSGIADHPREVAYYEQDEFKVRHDDYTGLWEVPEKNRFSYSNRFWRQYESINRSVYGTARLTMLQILEMTLNQKTAQVTDEVVTDRIGANGKRIKTRVVNQAETVKALEKQEKLIAAFQSWVWTNPARAARLKNEYAIKFGNIRRRVFDGSFLELPSMNPAIQLFDYQKNAVARILFTPNTLLAHDVGAGKTYIMIAAGMELRRLGKSKKNLYVVPNNILGQWEDTFRYAYPDARVLVINEKNFSPSKRSATLRRICEEDFDAILMAYSSFDMLPLSKKYYVELYNQTIELLEIARKTFKSKGRIDAKLKHIRNEIHKLHTQTPKRICDVAFDELGINTLFVDEAHYYKNVPIDSEISRVHGINKAGSAKCAGMMDKIHCIQRQNDGGRVVFATGTPITNSLTDIFVLQKYLQEGELVFSGIQNFDNWVGMFAEKSTEYEIDVDTNSYQLKTRFVRFKNVPELTAMFSSVADFHHEDKTDELPDFDGYTDSLAQGSEAFAEYLRQIAYRADEVRSGRVDRKDDNLLKITTDGRKAALDMRLVDPAIGREPEAKAVRCAQNVYALYRSTRSFRGVQLVFCDVSTPKAGFNMYDEVKSLLVTYGIPADEIAFIHDATSDRERESLFARLREGDKSVVIGSTFKMGHGVNVQDRLVALHHLDVPWRPADMMQREGRILRRGNHCERIHIFRYVTKGSFDAYSWQLLEGKQRFIAQILAGSCSARECADVDETVLNYAEVKALAVGNPLIKKRVELMNELSKYQILKRELIDKRERQKRELLDLPEQIARQKQAIALCEKDVDQIDELLAEERKQQEAQEEAKASRKSAFEAKTQMAAMARELEKTVKKAERVAQKAEAAAQKDATLLAEAQSKREEADGLALRLRQMEAELSDAKETWQDARQVVAAATPDESDAYRELRDRIYDAACASVNLPADFTVGEYRGFSVVIPAYMRPRMLREKTEDGQIVDSGKLAYTVELRRNGRYAVSIVEKLGILIRFNNVIDDMRGQKDRLDKALAILVSQKQALEDELANPEDYGERIDSLKDRLDEIDKQLGLKEDF